MNFLVISAILTVLLDAASTTGGENRLYFVDKAVEKHLYQEAPVSLDGVEQLLYEGAVLTVGMDEEKKEILQKTAVSHYYVSTICSYGIQDGIENLLFEEPVSAKMENKADDKAEGGGKAKG
ncbi:hypothetical protein CAEBREN_00750 [Caenorhabditis brenneri]|uniref:Uncharacterized protein n=1 Tax=Caenorhabditis brenneri TaxID=135651 RepID=G0NUB5_CAEBE|nr:hypothetical protein CAEBREN_00750 [Caenorhabditis brenneri]